MNKTITEIMQNEWRERALYVLLSRAVPSFADGFKPVQRFLFYSGLKKAKTSFMKVAGIAGSIAEYGFHHGEESGADALILMTADWCNNLKVFEGRGNFGSRFDNSAGAARYIFAKLSDVVDLLFLDNDLAPKHPEEEHIPPKFYLPIIPMILVNGSKGIATGYACDIPPHDPVSIIDRLISMTRGKDEGEIKPKFYSWDVDIVREGNRYMVSGKWEIIGNTLKITEIPPNFCYETYEKVLDTAQEKGFISGYKNSSVEDLFSFDVFLKPGFNRSDENIEAVFKLKQGFTWNVTSISPEGKFQEWNPDTAFEDVVRAFYAFRLPYVALRIQKRISELSEMVKYFERYIQVSEDIVSGKFSLKKTEDECLSVLTLEYGFSEEQAKDVISSPIRSFTTKNIQKSRDALESTKKAYIHYSNTTPEKEYRKDLEALKKFLTK